MHRFYIKYLYFYYLIKSIMLQVCTMSSLLIISHSFFFKLLSQELQSSFDLCGHINIRISFWICEQNYIRLNSLILVNNTS